MLDSASSGSVGTEGEPLHSGLAYYLKRGAGAYSPTIHAQGAWSPHEQHMAPVSGLLVHELDNCQPREDLILARVTFDIFGVIPLEDFNVETRVIRPGRSVELLQAELYCQGKIRVRATAWRLLASDTAEVAHGSDLPLPGLSAATEEPDVAIWPGGFIRSLWLRAVPGDGPGHRQAWLGTQMPLVAGEPSSDMSRLLGLVDSANGIAPLVNPAGEYVFPNTDLSVHMYRPPQGELLGLETTVTFGANGIGLTPSALHDSYGPFGKAEQILTIRRRRSQA